MGKRQAVRWSVVPESQDAAGETAPAGSDFLEKDLVQRIAAGPLRWQLNITLANPGDPVNDASKAWPGRAQGVERRYPGPGKQPAAAQWRVP